MEMPELPWEGGCRCGRVRFRVTKPPMVTAACHCRGCQRMTAGAFSTTLILPPDGFEITQGATVAGGMHGGPTKGDHQHCDWCKSWLFTRVPPEWGVVNVRATMLDDSRWFAPFMETCTSEALPWAKTPARRSYEKFPEPAAFAGIMAEFAAQ